MSINMKITKYAQSCVLIEIDAKRILIDPGKYCYDRKFKPEDWKDIDILLLSHGHHDHCMPEAVEIIYNNNKPLIIGSKWVGKKLADKKIPLEVFETGQKKEIEGISITAIRAQHGEHPEMKTSPGHSIGFLIEGEKSLYHCSDTLYMKNKPYADVVLVPISDNWVTMGSEEAAIFVNEIKPKLAIPIHYDSERHLRDPTKFLEAMKGSNILVKILNHGESVEL